MDALLSHTIVPLASSGSFLVQPSTGLTIWTIVVFLLSMVILAKWVFPLIRRALDRRKEAIDESLDAAERTRHEADQLLVEYRERLREARGQAEEIVQRARQAANVHARDAQAEAHVRRGQMMEQTRREIEAETRRAIEEIRSEVADLTVLATEKVTRKTLSEQDQRRLVDEALKELDFTELGVGGEG
ncbi:MAG: F0F1 ATP synthase subunit B [Solirubrobacteraceae bacterium]